MATLGFSDDATATDSNRCWSSCCCVVVVMEEEEDDNSTEAVHRPPMEELTSRSHVWFLPHPNIPKSAVRILLLLD